MLDEIEVLDALTLHERDASRRAGWMNETPRNLVCVHLRGDLGPPTEVEFIIDGESIGWIDAVKLVKLAKKLKI